ncbi:MAG: YDG domain-containing protein [Chitinophagales bacterium]
MKKILTLGMILLIAGKAFSQTTYSWTGSSGGAWLTSTNWSPNGPLATTGIASFGGSNTSTTVGLNTNTQSSTTLSAITFLSGTSTANLAIGNSGTSGTGGTITLNSATINSVANTIIRSTSAYGFTLQDNVGSGNKTLGIVLGSSTDNKISVEGAGNVTISSIISGASRNLTKVGSGTGALILSGVNTYSGTTTITAGELRLNPSADNSLTGACTLNGGTLATTSIAASRAVTYSSLNLSDNSTIALGSNAHTLTFTAAGTFTSGKVLTITGWSGTYSLGTTSGTAGKIFVGNTATSLTSTQLGQIRFYDGTNYFFARQLSTGEIVPCLMYAVSAPTPSTPVAGTGFSVTVQSVGYTGTAINMSAASGFTLSTNGNAGAIGGTVTGTIASGTNSVTVTGVTLATSGSGVTITATNSSGNFAQPGTSATFSVSSASTPVVTGGSASGNVGAAFSYFISATNSPTSYALASGTLPSGLSLNTTTGEISGTPTAVGSASVTVTASNGSGTSSPATISFTIGKGTQVLSGLAGTDSKVYGSAAYALGTTINSGLTLSYSSSNTGVATVSGGTVTIVGVGSTTITVSQAGDANWNALSPSGSQVLTVTAKALTITGLTGANKTYDGSTSASFTGTPALSGVVGSDVVTLGGSATAVFANKNVGTAKAISVSGYTISGAQSGNYTLTQPTLTGDINALTLTISSAAVTTKVYDGTTAATITGTLSGIISPDVVTLNGTGTFASANAGSGIAVTSTSTLGGADAGNYSLTQPTGLTGTITQASQSITFGSLATKTTADAPFSLTATASSGLSVSYTSSDPTVATISGSTVTIVGAGTTVITAAQPGNGNYSAATSVTQNLVVTVAPVTLGTYPFTGTTCTNYAASSVVSNLTMANMTVTGITCNTNVATNIFGGNASWGTAFSSTRYLEITLTPDAGYALTVSSIALDVWRSSAGATNFVLRSSLDSYTSDLGTGSVTTTQTTNTITLSSSFQNLTTAVTFRIYGYGGNSTGDFRVDNITPSGNIFSSCSAPSSQAASISTGGISDIGLNASFNRGSSAGSILVIRPTAQTNALPVALTTYTANTNWSSAGQINTNNRVLANSTASASSTVNVNGISGLTAETQYTLTAYEYSGTSCYNTTSPPSATFYTLSTEPTAQPTSGLSATTCTTNTMSVTVPAPANGADGYLVIYKGGSAPTGLPTDGQAYSAGSTFGDATVGAIATAAGTVTVSGLSSNTNYYFQLVPYNSNAALTAATYNYLTSGTLLQTNFSTVAVAASASSRVGTSVTYGYSSNIDYLTYQSATVPASSSQSQGVFQITIKDGDGATADADALPTLLSGVTFTYTGTSNTILAAALFTSSGSKIADGTVGLNSITFSGMTSTNVTAPDNDSIKAILRVTFGSTVTDNQKLVYTVTSVTAGSACTSSQFAAANGGGAQSDNVNANVNKIVVTADRLVFGQQPSNASTSAVMSPAVTVRGVDVNGNLDLDFNGSVSVTSTGTLSGTPVSTSATSGVATFSALTHTASGTNLTLTATTSGLAFSNSVTSNTFTITSFPANSYRSTSDGTWGGASWEQLVSGVWTSSSAPATNTSNNVYIRNYIYTSTAISPANVIVESTGIFEIDHPSTVGTSLYIKTGGDLVVNNTLTVSGTFDVEDSAYVNLNFNFSNPSTSIWAGTENFRPKSVLIINHWRITSSTNLPLFNGDVTLNTYNGYSAAFGHVVVSFLPIATSGTASTTAINDHWELLGSSAHNKNLCHGNFEFSDPIGYDVRFCASSATTITTGIGGNLYLSANWSSARSVVLGTSSSTVTLNVKGNVIVDCPGDLVIRGGNSASGVITLNIDSNLVVNGTNTTTNTNVQFNSTGYSTSLGYATAIINLKGHLLVGANPTLISGAPAADIQFNFNGTSVQDINVASVVGSTSNVATTKGIPFTVKNGSSVRLKSNNLSLNNSSSFTVENNATLDFNWNDAGTTPLLIQQPTSSVFGTNTINTLQGCTLKITSPGGLIVNTSTYGLTTGNVQQLPTSNRSYSTLATFWYTGKTAQVTGDAMGTSSNGRIVICDLADNSVSLTPTTTFALTNNTTLSGTGGKLDIRKGQFTETTSAYITGSTGTLYMSAGTLYKVVKGNATASASNSDLIPRMDGVSFAYTLNGGTIELGGTGSTDAFQTLRGGRTYKYITYSGANTFNTDYKNLSSNVTIDSGLTVSGSAVVDCIDNSNGPVSFTGTGGLYMTGTSRLRMKTLNTTLPELTATSTSPAQSYSLTGGTIEWYGSGTAQTHSMRGTYGSGSTPPNVTYNNVEINSSGSNVGQGAANVVAQAGFNVNGTMNVNSPACFQLGSGFTIGGTGTFNVNSGSTFKYGGTLFSTGASGAVQTTTRSFSSSASYGFVGSVAQTAGTGLPSSMVNMYFDKANPGNTVRLSQSTSVSDTIIFYTGVAVTGTNVLTANGAGSNAIRGFETPFTSTSGSPSYANDRYVFGNLERNIGSTGIYTFPVGDTSSREGYNPVRLNIISGTGKATAKFVYGNPGAITADTAITCSGKRSRIKYTGMTGEGWWNFTSSTGTTFNYDIYLHPNQNNNNTNPNETVLAGNTQYVNNYRALKATTGTGGGTWPASAATAGEPCNVSNTYYNIIGTNYSGFSDFAPGGGAGNTTALPVKLIAFTALPINNEYIQLNWTTATEIDNRGFDIERSLDGKVFEKIGWKDGRGTTSAMTSYQMNDVHAEQGQRYYYRLKQIDVDGNFEYSPIVSAMLNGDGFTTEVALLPVPARDHVYVTITSEEASNAVLKVMNLLGEEVLRTEMLINRGANAVELPLAGLPAGNYILYTQTGTAVFGNKLTIAR